MSTKGTRRLIACAAALLGAVLFVPAAHGEPGQIGLVEEINPGAAAGVVSGGGAPGASIDGKAIFAGNDGTNGVEPWVSDGTPEGTQMLANVAGDGASSIPLLPFFTRSGDYVFFVADNLVDGPALWRTDGTPAGTAMVRDINATSSTAGFIAQLHDYKGTLLFFANDGTGTELWRSDGTPGGTQVVEELGAPSATVQPSAAVAGDRLFYGFATGTPATSGLYASDGTPAGTGLVAEGSTGGVAGFVGFGGSVFFPAGDLWRTSPTGAGGITLIKSITGEMGPLSVADNRMFFAAGPDTEEEPWVSDGTPAGTVQLGAINPGSGSNPGPFVAAAGTVLFAATDATAGRELWKTDGTPGNLQRVTDLRAGAANGADLGAAFTFSANGRLYFAGNDGATGFEPYVSDGTAAGTVPAHDIATTGPGPGPYSSFPSFIARTSDRVFFSAENASTPSSANRELYVLEIAPDGEEPPPPGGEEPPPAPPSADTTPPDTEITAGPPNKAKKTKASFEFTGTDNVSARAALTFECSLDRKPFDACASPRTYRNLKRNKKHRLEVVAIDEAGNSDPSPATDSWKVKKKRKVKK